MAKGKKKPASKPQAKKVEPTPKKVASKVKEVVEEIVEKVKKVKKIKAKVPAKVPVKEVKPILEIHKREDTIHSKYRFPSIDDCKHEHTRRTIDRRMRVMHVCMNPVCKKVVRYGSR